MLQTAPLQRCKNTLLVQSQVFKHKNSGSGTNGIQFLVAYAELRKATISFFMYIGRAIRPH
jgi:hypothetical protein